MQFSIQCIDLKDMYPIISSTIFIVRVYVCVFVYFFLVILISIILNAFATWEIYLTISTQKFVLNNTLRIIYTIRVYAILACAYERGRWLTQFLTERVFSIRKLIVRTCLVFASRSARQV